MQKKVFRYTAMGFFVTTCMLSCIDNDYDLSKDISLDVSLGNKALFFPIGNTEELKLSDIIEIETDGTIQIEENGQYYLTKSGTINPVDFSVNPVKIDIEDVLFNIDPINFDTPSNIPATAPDMTVMISEEISKEAKLEIKEYINKDIISLKKIFVDANSSTKMSFEFSITGLPSSVKKVAFEDIYIELPDFILFKDENIINGKLTFNKDQDYIDLTNGNNKFTKVIEINGVDSTKLEGEYENGYNLAEKNNILEIDADVWIKGVFSAEVKIGRAHV